MQDIASPSFRSALALQLAGNSKSPQSLRECSSTRARWSSCSAREVSCVSRPADTTCSPSLSAASTFEHVSAKALFDNAVNAIIAHWASGAGVSALAQDDQVLLLGTQFAEPHVSDQIRKPAFEKVASMCFERIQNVEYIKHAQNILIKAFMFRGNRANS